jgi:hypothetical protein
MNPGFVVAFIVVPVTPDHIPNDCEIAASISENWALLCGGATVRIVGGAEGSAVLQRLLSGEARETFQRSG